MLRASIAGSAVRHVSGLRQVRGRTLLAKDVGIMLDVADRVGATKPPHVVELARVHARAIRRTTSDSPLAECSRQLPDGRQGFDDASRV